MGALEEQSALNRLGDFARELDAEVSSSKKRKSLSNATVLDAVVKSTADRPLAIEAFSRPRGKELFHTLVNMTR
jgi:hypothetical protein